MYVAGATAPASDVLVRDDDAAGAAAPEPLLRRDEAVPAAETPAVDSSAAEPPAAAGGDVAAPNGTNHFFGSYRNALYFTNWCASHVMDRASLVMSL